jgi:hypothetical protein
MTLASTDELRCGQPVTVIAVKQAVIDIPYATFAVAQPDEWQLLDGGTRWRARRRKGSPGSIRVSGSTCRARMRSGWESDSRN